MSSPYEKRTVLTAEEVRQLLHARTADFAKLSGASEPDLMLMLDHALHKFMLLSYTIQEVQVFDPKQIIHPRYRDDETAVGQGLQVFRYMTLCCMRCAGWQRES